MVDKFVATLNLRLMNPPAWWRNRWQRSWWWAVLLTPVVTLWSGALKDLHSDYLQWILQTQNNPSEQLVDRIFYWPQLVLAWSWDLELTARLNTLLRVASFIYCVFWCGRLISVIARAQWWRVGIGMVGFCLCWFWWWPEVGDSLIYSGHTLGMFLLLIALGDPSTAGGRLSQRWFVIALVIVSYLATATYVHLLLVALPLVVIVFFFSKFPKRNAQSLLVKRIAISGSVAAGVAVGVFRIGALSDEETGWTTFGLKTKILNTRHLWDGNLYLWDSLRLSVLLFLVSIVLVCHLRQARLMVLASTGFTISLGVVPIAALKHVQTSLMMPRYFATQIIFGLLIQFVVVLITVCRLASARSMFALTKSHEFYALRIVRNAIAVVFVSTTILVLASPLGFGRDYRDQSGNSKVAVPLSGEVVTRLHTMQRESGGVVLVNMKVWDSYPSVFRLQRAGVRSLALDTEPTFDFGQKDFMELLDTRSFLGVCEPRFTTCVSEFGDILNRRGIRRLQITEIDRVTETSGRVISVLQIRPQE